MVSRSRLDGFVEDEPPQDNAGIIVGKGKSLEKRWS